MVIFIALYIIILLLSFKIKKNKFTIYDFIALAIMILLSGLRGVGNDLWLYHRLYTTMEYVDRTRDWF